MSILNIEIKARTDSHQNIREILKNRNAEFLGTDHQIDTYFNAPSGRLKLREGNIENNLIHYNREDMDGPKKSEVTLLKIEPNSALKKILTDVLGVKVVVDKKRDIYFIENVKFHIDDVKGLGSFVEIEAIDKNRTLGKNKLMEQCNFFMELFKIPASDLVSVSYSDMLLDK